MRSPSEIETCHITFIPDNIIAEAAVGDNLLKVAVDHGIHIDATCGGAGVCGKCRVEVQGDYRLSEADYLHEDEQEAGVLACRCEVLGDCTVTVPEATRVTGTLPSRSEGSTRRVRLTGLDADARVHECGVSPLLTKQCVTVEPPAADVGSTDRFRLAAALEKQGVPLRGSLIDIELMRRMPTVLREQDGQVTATLSAQRDDAICGGLPLLVNLETGDTSEKLYAVAFDIGTTSVWAQWLDLKAGTVLAEAADYNDQIRFGADVINRILACKKEGGLSRVRQAVVDTMNRLLEQMAEQCGLPLTSLAYAVAAGNTTMSHILLEVDPRHIQLAPHVPVTRFFPPVKAATLGLSLDSQAPLFSIPNVSAWVGGDIVAGALVAGFTDDDPMTLYIDLGTNGEIVVGNKEFLMSASCSAGPAFEGGGIKHGVRAMKGAIEDFHLNGPDAEPMVLTIGQARANGICGSGLINTVAALFLAGVLQPNGKYIAPDGIRRLRETEDGLEYVLVEAANSAGGQDITLTEVDVENLLRAKAAVFAGITTLMSEVGMDPSMFDQVLIAGSFGQSLDVERAITIGLLPDLPLDRFRFIGNGSLAGARLTAQCMDGFRWSEALAHRITYIDLGVNPRFMDDYVAGMFLPHTAGHLFPAVTELLRRQKDG